MVEGGQLRRWYPGIDEPETAAFGGDTGVRAAPMLFAADSRHVFPLNNCPEASPGRRELSVLLATVMMRAAGLEWYGQGDVWDRVIGVEQRSVMGNGRESELRAMTRQVRTLPLSDTTQDGPLMSKGGPLHHARVAHSSHASWASAG